MSLDAEVLDTVTLPRHDATGAVIGTVSLDPEMFSVPVNVPLVHQVVTAHLATRRSGTQSTKTRAEVKGGSAKPFRQKGTGNARQGSIRAPHYSGGGIALGPKPRSYAQRTPKKMVQRALRCALSDRAQEGAVRVIERFDFSVPKTKDGVTLLQAIEADGRVLVVVGRGDDIARRSFANLPNVMTLPKDQLTAYDVLCADVIVFTEETLPGSPEATTMTASAPAAKRPARAPRAAKAPAKNPEDSTAAETEAPDLEAETVETAETTAAEAPAAPDDVVVDEPSAEDSDDEGTEQ